MKLANELQATIQEKIRAFTNHSVDDAIQRAKNEAKKILNNTTCETKDRIFAVATIGVFSLIILEGLTGKKTSKLVRTDTMLDMIPAGSVFNITYTENKNTYNYYGKECKCGGACCHG